MARRGSDNEARVRPPRDQVDPAALALIARHGSDVLRTARRHSATAEDAEDAYQRALEILLTKAPTTVEDELVPWLKTVVKHEAWAIRRARERATPVTDDGEVAERIGSAAQTHEAAERLERLALCAEALGRLKPNELRALLLRAEGYSYKQICATTGWTYTKVNRCITEGRRALVDRLDGIRNGAECARLEPRLSALADGEASAEDLELLRPHLRSCLSCKARLREFRATPARVAAIVPPFALIAQPEPLERARRALEAVLAAVQDRVAAIGERAHSAAELATGQKVAAVAGSAAALAGGGAGVERIAAEHARPAATRQQAAPRRPVVPALRLEPRQGAPPRGAVGNPAAPAASAPPKPPAPRASAASEFDPGAVAAAAGTSANPPSPEIGEAPARSGAAGASEFAP
jgi:RNA polymerase sigma factor (sigma-70 family)